MLVRCVARGARAARGRVAGCARSPAALLLASPIWFAPMLGAERARGGAAPATHGDAGGYPNPASEPVLAAQAFLLDDALDKLEDERPGVTDLYFVGFAPTAREDVFRKDVEAAQQRDGRALGHRAAARSCSSTIRGRCSTAPFATVTNLRETLNEIGAAIDADEDVVMVYLASHGSARLTRSPSSHAAARARRAHAAPACAAARRRRHQVADRRRLGVLLGRLHRGAEGRPHAGHDRRARRPHVVRLRQRAATRRSSARRCSSRGSRSADSLLAAFDVAKERVAERERAHGFAAVGAADRRSGAAMAAQAEELRTAAGESRRRDRPSRGERCAAFDAAAPRAATMARVATTTARHLRRIACVASPVAA